MLMFLEMVETHQTHRFNENPQVCGQNKGHKDTWPTNPSLVHWPNKYKFISSTWAHDTCSWNDLRYKLRQKSLELPIKDMLTWGYRIMPLWMQSQPNGARMPRIWYYTPTHDVGTCTTNDIDAPPNGTCIRKWWWHAH